MAPQKMRRILLVDDDVTLRSVLVEQLALQEEFEIDEAADAKEAITLIEKNIFDIILLDVGLPDMDGRDLCRLLRRRAVSCPIIMLTAQASDADTILGLESGANDYIAKPFRFGILLARIRAQLRQHEQSEDAVFHVGPYLFRPAMKILEDKESGQTIRLTEKEAAILRFLHRAGERPVSRDTLLEEVWGYRSGITTHTLETHVYRLRKKIEKNPADAKILVTDAGGYRLAS